MCMQAHSAQRVGCTISAYRSLSPTLTSCHSHHLHLPNHHCHHPLHQHLSCLLLRPTAAPICCFASSVHITVKLWQPPLRESPLTCSTRNARPWFNKRCMHFLSLHMLVEMLQDMSSAAKPIQNGLCSFNDLRHADHPWQLTAIIAQVLLHGLGVVKCSTHGTNNPAELWQDDVMHA